MVLDRHLDRDRTTFQPNPHCRANSRLHAVASIEAAGRHAVSLTRPDAATCTGASLGSSSYSSSPLSRVRLRSAARARASAIAVVRLSAAFCHPA
jgi:hypothetical protein